jgi:thiamine kinase-like enzyme
MLLEGELLDYLLELGIVSTEDIVSDGLAMADVSRRHQNLAIATQLGGRAFVKQQVQRNIETLAREAHAYEHLWRARREFAAAHMVRSRIFDRERGLLVLENLDGAETLSAAESRRAEVAETAAEELGRALALLHRHDPDAGYGPPPLTPWVLSAGTPSLDTLAQLSAAAIAAVQILQQSSVIQRGLGGLSSVPAACWTLTHGDLRLDNCLIQQDDDIDLRRLVLVDWELAGAGDLCFDVGAVLADYLSIWVRSMPWAASLTVADSVALASRPLASICGSVKAFWKGYLEESVGHPALPVLPTRSLRWTGARLVQSAIESAQETPTLPSTSVMLLQLAENVMADPPRTLRLLGIQ